MRKKDFGLALSIGILLFLAVFSPRKILVAEGFLVSDAELDRGAAVYARFCGECHDTGRNGAPRPGDVQSWDERLEKGIDQLLAEAANCVQPVAGATKPTGDDFAMATAYMIAAGQGKRRRPRRRKRAA